jgi:hypothetical protein
MPWDDADRWEDGLRSLLFLQRLLIRSSRSLRERLGSEGGDWLGPVQLEHEGLESVRRCQREDDEVRKWLLFSPPHLTHFVIWTKAFAGGAKGERLVTWGPNEMGVGWHKVFDQPIKGGDSEFDESAFV